MGYIWGYTSRTGHALIKSKSLESFGITGFFLVGATGFEPTTFWSRSRETLQWEKRGNMGLFRLFLGGASVFGVAGRDRTAHENTERNMEKGAREAVGWGTFGVRSIVLVSGVEGGPDIGGEGVRVGILQAGVDLQGDLRIGVAGQVLDALQIHL